MPDSPTAGSFTNTLLQKSIARLDDIWADNQTVEDYVPEVAVVEAIRKEQTATLVPLQDKDKDRILKIIWVADCNTGVEDCDEDEDDCAFTGSVPETKSKEYELDICFKVKFTLDDDTFRTNEFDKEDALAKAWAARLKEMDEKLAMIVAAKLQAFAGVNQYEGFPGQVDGVNTYIPASYWAPDLYGYFNLVKIKNKLRNPYMIHGSNLYMTNWNNQYLVANANQKDGLPKLQSMRSYWDLFNIDAANPNEQVSYLITKGAIAIANKAKYPLNSPKVWTFGKRWSIESKALPGIYYDVIYKERCEGENVFYDFKIKFLGGVFLNPFGCNEDVTGVLRFVCGNAPAES